MPFSLVLPRRPCSTHGAGNWAKIRSPGPPEPAPPHQKSRLHRVASECELCDAESGHTCLRRPLGARGLLLRPPSFDRVYRPSELDPRSYPKERQRAPSSGSVFTHPVARMQTALVLHTPFAQMQHQRGATLPAHISKSARSSRGSAHTLCPSQGTAIPGGKIACKIWFCTFALRVGAGSNVPWRKCEFDTWPSRGRLAKNGRSWSNS